MESGTTTKVSRKAVVDLFKSAPFNFPNASKWSTEKMMLKIKKIPKLLSDDSEIPEDSRSLLESLLSAVDKGETIILEDDMKAEKKEKEEKAKDKANASEVGKKKKRKAPTANVGAGKGYRVLGHSSTSVIHWLGKNGFDYEQAARVLKYFKVFNKIKESNIKARLAVGRDKTRSKPADLTSEQAAQIKKLAKAKAV